MGFSILFLKYYNIRNFTLFTGLPENQIISEQLRNYYCLYTHIQLYFSDVNLFRNFAWEQKQE